MMGQSWESKFGSEDPGFPGFRHSGLRNAGTGGLHEDDAGQGDACRNTVARRGFDRSEIARSEIARDEPVGCEVGGDAADGAPPISRILQDPHISDWLKQALRDALSRDPDDVLRDLQTLDLVIRARARRRPGQPEAPFSWVDMLVW